MFRLRRTSHYPDPKGYGDRKAVLMIRQSLDDDSKAAMVALHGAGMVHLAWRPEKDVRVTDMEFRMGGRGRPGGASPRQPRDDHREANRDRKARRRVFALCQPRRRTDASVRAADQTASGRAVLCGHRIRSHLPETVDTAVLSNVVLENAAGGAVGIARIPRDAAPCRVPAASVFDWLPKGVRAFMAYVLALDQGTTSSRAILFDEAGAIAAVAQHEFQQFYPQAGWVEHDPTEILTSQMSCAVEALGKVGARPRDVAAIGITNQRETVIVWERATGKPIHPAIVWQDRRTAAFCKDLEEGGAGETVSAKTGLVLDPYFSATKVKWILDNVEGARARAERGELAFGTVDSWLIWHLTSGQKHVTDVTNASRTLLYNIVKGEWDEELLKLFGVPESMLPEVMWSSERVGEVTTTLGLGGVAIAGIAGDQQAALFGQLCWSAGEAKNTYGTGCFLLQNIGTDFMRSKHG